MKRQTRKLLDIAALFLFAAATFQIADGSMPLGIVFFAAATCFASLGRIYRKRKAEETERSIQTEKRKSINDRG